MEDRRGMLEFAGLADDGCLAVALRLRRRDAERGDRAPSQQVAEFLADGHQRLEVGFETSGAGIGDHRDRGGATGRRRHRAPHLDMGLVDDRRELADAGLHRNPSSPLTSLARRPPTRSWTRPPVDMTRISTISSARGASLTPTSMALKCPRT